MEIRPARDEDAAQVIALIARVYAEYPGCVLDVEREEPALAAPASRFDRFWVLVDDAGRVRGTVACALHDAHAELKKLYLDAQVRGAGWGRRLIELAEAEARAAGLPRVELWSDLRFETAHAVYLRLGYRASGSTRELHDLSHTTEAHFRKDLPAPGTDRPPTPVAL
jgi:putative acetyltransferase